MRKGITDPTTDLRVRYLAALIDGDRGRAGAAVGEGLARGLDVPTLLQVLAAAQTELGELWHRGDVTVAQEHWGTQVTFEEIERVLAARRGVGRLGRRVVVATVPGETHTLPARIVAGLFAWRGWTADFLGESPPGDDLPDYLRRREADLVALSVTLAAHRPQATALCQRLRDALPAVPILVGGAGVAGLAADELGADAVALDAGDGLERAGRFVGLSSERDLDAYLAVVGRRIQDRRRAVRLSQGALAERSELTRPYLSAVERGRQNITLEAALRIAGALEIGMAELLSESTP